MPMTFWPLVKGCQR